MASSTISVLSVTQDGEIRVQKALVQNDLRTYDTFVFCGDKKLVNSQEVIVRDKDGKTHKVVLWDDGTCEDDDEDNTHAVYGLLVPPPGSSWTVDCDVCGIVAITGLGEDIHTGDSEGEEE
jgi:hypothetical protein